jgi:hypothetical protein
MSPTGQQRTQIVSSEVNNIAEQHYRTTLRNNITELTAAQNIASDNTVPIFVIETAEYYKNVMSECLINWLRL